MPVSFRWYLVCGVSAAALAIAAAACGRPSATPPTAAPPTAATGTGGPGTGTNSLVNTPVPAATFTAVPPPTPTVTPEPLAATVNDEPITLAAYEKEVQRCQAGQTSAGYDGANCPAAVLQSLIEQEVVEQVAATQGLSVSADELDAALAGIEQELGGAQALGAWESANLYTDEEFRAALQGDLLRARLAEQVIANQPATAEQVHARAILVTAEETAQIVLAELQAGADFATVALNYSRDLSSRAAGGDLGWFPRGMLTVPEVEEAAFGLQPGETSGIVPTRLGFHIVQTIEREPFRPLSPAAAQALRAAAFTAWLDELLAGAAIQRHVSP